MIRQRLRGLVEAWLLRVWFGPASAADRLLAAIASPAALPVSWLVAAVARRRRHRIVRQDAGPGIVPVVVVGNLVAGGSGKTPLVAAIAHALVAAGFRPGLLAGGYRARAAAGRGPRLSEGGAMLVDGGAETSSAGDEAVLLALQTGLPLAVAKDRSAAAALLRAGHPECDVIISDDGLQHVALARRIELLVIDDRGFGNGRCLPAGPLREPEDRIDSVDAVVLTSAQEASAQEASAQAASAQRAAGKRATPRRRHARQFDSGLRMERFRALDGSGNWLPEDFARRFAGDPLSAIAGIARPQRFFASLRSLGLEPGCHALPDHADIDPAWLGALPGRWILMTGKDAVKCRHFPGPLRARCACLDVTATPDPALLTWLVARLRQGGH